MDELLRQVPNSLPVPGADRAHAVAVELVAKLNSGLIIEDLKRGWASKTLQGEETAPTSEHAPLELAARFGSRDVTDPLSIAASHLCARAMACKLSEEPPDWKAWERALEESRFFSWEEFCEDLSSHLSAEWLELLAKGPPDLESTIFGASSDERAALGEISKQWMSQPTAFDSRLFRQFVPLHGAPKSALGFLRDYKPNYWFRAVRETRLPVLVKQALGKAANSLGQLTILLRDAPPSLDQGKETKDVIASLIAKSALTFPERIVEHLQSRSRGALAPEGVAEVDKVLRVYLEEVAASQTREAIRSIADRTDGRELLRALFLDLLADLEFHPLQPRDRTMREQIVGAIASFLLEDCGTHAGIELWEWSLSATVVQNKSPFTRYLGAALVSTGGWKQPGTLDARVVDALWGLLRRCTSEGRKVLGSFADAGNVPGWIYYVAGVPFRYMECKAKEFNLAFSELAQERQAGLVEPDYDNRALGSRCLVLSAIGSMQGGDTVASSGANHSFCAEVWSAVRALWLRAPMEIGQDITHLVLYFFGSLPLSVPLSDEAASEFLSYIVVDPALAIRVGAVLGQAAEPAEIIACFDRAGANLGDLVAAVDGLPEYWAPPGGALERVRSLLEQQHSSSITDP